MCLHHCVQTVLFATPHRISPLFATRRAAVYKTAVSLRLALTIPFSLIFSKSQLAFYIFPGHEIHNWKGEGKACIAHRGADRPPLPFRVIGLIFDVDSLTQVLYFDLPFFSFFVMDGAREGIAMRKRISTA